MKRFFSGSILFLILASSVGCGGPEKPEPAPSLPTAETTAFPADIDISGKLTVTAGVAGIVCRMTTR